MTSVPGNAVAKATLVLVVLSKEQRKAHERELAGFDRPGIRVVFEESPEAALDFARTSDPALVIVGISLGTMEGLEFLALLLKKRPDFGGKVVVLPDKGDPFSPVVQQRNPKSGKSTTETLDLAAIEKLVTSLAAPSPAMRPVLPAKGPALPPPLPPRPVKKPTAQEPADKSAIGASELTTLPVSFAVGRADYQVLSSRELEAAVHAIQHDIARTGSHLEVGGHTSNEAGEGHRELALRRAANVKEYLVRHGIAQARIILRAYETSAPVDQGKPGANRRVTIRLLH